MEENSLEDDSDTNLINQCEEQLQEIVDDPIENSDTMFSGRNVEKRQRESEGSSEDGFITFTRRKAKKIMRNEESRVGRNKSSGNLEENEDIESIGYEITLTSLKQLPKQMAFARMMKSENIKNITKIKYKSPFKVLIQFSNKDQADKLINCQKIAELDIRCQYTDNSFVSYGMIKGVDLEMKENEILENLDSSSEILSVLRLKRMSLDGKWIDSETVRICFKNACAPTYVYAYGISFKVEKYIFPVTQCSACWKFGHIKKYCSLNKIICPKCGGEHANCETEVFKCINCKGPHMAINKSCPHFLREKRIRMIMSQENVTYKKALDIFLNKKNREQPIENHYLTSTQNTEEIIHNEDSYSNAVRNRTSTTQEEASNNSPNRLMNSRSMQTKKNHNNERKQKKKNLSLEQEDLNMQSGSDNTQPSYRENYIGENNTQKSKERHLQIWQAIMKIRDVLKCNDKFEEKVMAIIKIVFNEIKSFVSNFLSGEQIFTNFFNFLNG